MPGAGVLPDPNPKKMNKTLLASVVFEIYIRCSFLLSLFNMQHEKNGEDLVLVFGTQKIHPTGEFVWNLIADMESILKETASTLHELFMKFGTEIPKPRVMDRLQQALSTHPNLAYFEMKNASSEQGTSPVDASKVVKIEFSPEDSMDFLAILKKSGTKEDPKMIVKLNSKTVAQLRVLKEKLSKKTTKEVRFYCDNIENEDTAFGQPPDESDGALVWNNIPPFQHGEKSPSLLENRQVLKHVLEHLNGIDFAILRKVSSQVRHNVEAIRPTPKITSFSIELKTPREIKLTVNGTIILYKESRIRLTRRGQVVDRDIRSISINDLGIMLKNQRNIIGTVILNFANDSQLFELLRSEVLWGRRKLKIVSLEMTVSSQQEILTILPHIDSNALKILCIKGNPIGHLQKEIDLSDVLCLEQWKNVEQLTMNTLIIENGLQELNLDNKTNVDILVKLLSMEDLGYLMEKFLDTPQHIQYRIKYKLHEDNNQNQFDMHQDDFYFRNPDTHQELSISRHKENGFTFSRFERTNAPMGHGTG